MSQKTTKKYAKNMLWKNIIKSEKSKIIPKKMLKKRDELMKLEKQG